jgi:hypothetical protein
MIMQQKSIVAHDNYLTPQATHRKNVFLGGMRLPRYQLGFCLDAAEQRSNDSSPGKNIAVGLVFQQNQNCVKGLFQEIQSKWIYRVAGGYICSLDI